MELREFRQLWNRGSRWSRRQESNLYFTLRRHAHYPLCYGEMSSEAQIGFVMTASRGTHGIVIGAGSTAWRQSYWSV